MFGKPIRSVLYPLYSRSESFAEIIAEKTNVFPIICNICGKFTWSQVETSNFRETCKCRNCGAFNRQRQIAFVLCNSVCLEHPFRNLREFLTATNLSIYNTETEGALHNILSKSDNYICSEYFGEQYKSGEIIDGKLNQDLMNLSFADNKFDIIISSDVFEHISDPYMAHKEIFRVLKKGGRHIFTVPFNQTEFLDDNRAYNSTKGIVYTKPTIYHEDPIRNEGVLVYNIFAIEMLTKLAKIGFRTNFYYLYKPFSGILGSNGIVFEAVKEEC